MIQRSHAIALSLLCASFVLQGCQSVKKTLGIDRDPPKEFAVTPSVQPLEMPPDFSCLPTPMPGVERPQDRIARQQQEEKFLGSTGNKKTLSAGQTALRTMCGIQANQEDIRPIIDTEARREDKKDTTIIEKLGIKKRKKGEVLNPHEEAAELQKQGIPQGAKVRPENMIPTAERQIQPQVETAPLPAGIFE